MRIISWNVNGLRARLKQGFDHTIKQLKPDILCIQETRARRDQLPGVLLACIDPYFSIHTKPGYAGSSIFIYNKELKPFLFVDDFPDNDEPGRVSILDFKDFKLINAYVPNSGQRLEKLPHRVEWQEKLKKYIESQMKPVIYCGDINCAPALIDCNVNVKAGTSHQERTAHKEILELGMVDVWRELNPTTKQFTWYSNQYNSKEQNRGMRIDAFIISKELMPQVEAVEQIQDIELIAGSDHVPIVLDINI
jgi:exodeoxyribonuclease-3